MQMNIGYKRNMEISPSTEKVRDRKFLMPVYFSLEENKPTGEVSYENSGTQRKMKLLAGKSEILAYNFL